MTLIVSVDYKTKTKNKYKFISNNKNVLSKFHCIFSFYVFYFIYKMQSKQIRYLHDT